MTRSLTLTALALLIGLGADSPAEAKGFGPTRQEEFIERFDGNDDGKLTQEEIDAWRANRVGEFNADGEDGLTIDEYEKLWLDAYRKRMVRRFQQLDEDGDGIVTEAEFVKPMSHFVDRTDRDDSGDVTLEEMKPRKRHQMRRGGGRGGHQQQGMRGRGGRGDGQDHARRGGGRDRSERGGREGNGRDGSARQEFRERMQERMQERLQERQEQMTSPLIHDPAAFATLPPAALAEFQQPAFMDMPLPMPLAAE
ncbi:MAG: hypothetical protein Alpg2KO_08980 [Alphaproteobacteria bacterium]